MTKVSPGYISSFILVLHFMLSLLPPLSFLLFFLLFPQISQEEIEQAFGGSERSSSRGYYSSMYSYSANAYMLMYRRIDLNENSGVDINSKINNDIYTEFLLTLLL